jgi:hypothetical protein
MYLNISTSTLEIAKKIGCVRRVTHPWGSLFNQVFDIFNFVLITSIDNIVKLTIYILSELCINAIIVYFLPLVKRYFKLFLNNFLDIYNSNILTNLFINVNITTPLLYEKLIERDCNK